MTRPISWFVVALTFVIAIILELVALPDMLSALRPEWLVLTQTYWLLRRPDKIGIASAFAIGIVMDVLTGSYLGIHSLALCIVSYLILGMHKRFRMYPVVQQAFVLFLLTGTQLMIVYGLRASLSVAEDGFDYLWQAVISAFVWPLLILIYDRLSFTFR